MCEGRTHLGASEEMSRRNYNARHNLYRRPDRRRDGRTLPAWPSVTDMEQIQPSVSVGPSIDWRAIFAGAVAAAAVSIVLAGFGAALGLSLTSARPYAGLSALTLGILTAIWFTGVNVAAFSAGGYVAGRMRLPVTSKPAEREFRDGAHGFLVWSLGTIFIAYVIASSASAVTGRVADVAGSMTGAAVRASVPSGDSVGAAVGADYRIDRMLRRNPGGAVTTINQDELRESAEIGRREDGRPLAC